MNRALNALWLVCDALDLRHGDSECSLRQGSLQGASGQMVVVPAPEGPDCSGFFLFLPVSTSAFETKGGLKVAQETNNQTDSNTTESLSPIYTVPKSNKTTGAPP